jgi:hypothetical protein
VATVNIEPGVNQLLFSLKEYWDRYKTVHPSYELDNSWLSLGVIDLLTFSYRFSVPDSGVEHARFREISGYLATVLAYVWKEYEIDSTISINGDEGIILSGTRGNDRIIFKLEEELKNRFGNMKNQFPVFKDYDRPLTFDSTIIHLFMIGPAIGWSTECTFPWHESSEERDKTAIKFQKIIARQYAKWFSRVVPENPLLQVPELYLQKLILPVFLGDKHPPLLSAAEATGSYLKNLGFSRSQLKAIGRDLVNAPDEILASYGILLHIAMCDPEETIDPLVIGSARSKNALIPLQRMALYKTAQIFGRTWNWFKENNEGKRSVFQYNIEQNLGMLSWFTLPYQKIMTLCKESWFQSFLDALFKFDIRTASRILDEQLELYPGDIDLRVQRVKFLMLQRDFDKAHESFKQLLSEPEADKNPHFFNNWGYISLELGEPDSAARYFKAALAICNDSNDFKAEILNNLAWSYMGIGKIEDAEALLNECISIASNPLTPLLNKAAIAWEERRIDEIYSIRKKIVALAPHDRRVFSSVTLLPAFTQ